MKIFVLFLCLSVSCHEISYSQNGKYYPILPDDSPIIIDMYGPGSGGFSNGTGGGSGAFIRAIIYPETGFEILINNEKTQISSPNLYISANSGFGIYGGTWVIEKIGPDDEIIISENGNTGTNKECVGGRCNTSPCLAGCQGRSLKQQIIPGSGGLAPYYLSLDGTILDNPDYEIDGRYTIYTTNLLNCCGSNILCATSCVEGVPGSKGNGGSGSINFAGGCCDNICYQETNCKPGIGGSGYIILSFEYENSTNKQSNPETNIVYILLLLLFLIGLFLFVSIIILVERYFRKQKKVNITNGDEL